MVFNYYDKYIKPKRDARKEARTIESIINSELGRLSYEIYQNHLKTKLLSRTSI